MDSVTRSSHRRKHSTTAANIFSSSFSFKNPYGDVLLSNGGERKSLQVHEYSEIFSGSSSIPVLDLSGLDERAGSGDSRSSKLDYTNIFGGLTHDEVFVPYEELLKSSAKKAKTRIPAEKRPYLQESGSRHSSKKTEMPHGVASDQFVDGFKMQESGSLSSTIKTIRPSSVASDQSVYGVKQQESDSPHPSRKRETPSGAASDQSVDGVKQQLSMPFSRTSQRDSDATDANTHTTKLNAIPGFTHSVDGNQSHKGKNDRPPLPRREISRAWSFSAEVEPASSKGGSNFEKLRGHDKSHNVNEVNIKSQSSAEPLPSSYPSNPSDIRDPRQSRASIFVAEGDVSQKITGESFEEFDDNSVDAVSAATLKKAIEQAQESIRIAKMIMERKKDGYQDGSKSRPITSPKVADRETKIEAFGAKDNSTGKNSAKLDPNAKLTPSLSHSGVYVWDNSETDRVHGETFAGGCKLFAPNHIKSEATHVANNVSSEKHEKKVEAAEVQREVKYLPGCGASYLEPTEVGNVNFKDGEGKLEMGKENFEGKNVTSNHTKGSEVVPELLDGAISTSQQTQVMEKSLEDKELCQARLDQAEVPEDNEGRVLNSSQRITENCNTLDEASKNLKIGQEDGANEQRENGRNSKEQHENELEECNEMVNERPEFNGILEASCNLVRNGSLDQEEMEKKTEIVSELHVDDWTHAKTSDEEIRGGGQTESHLWRHNKDLLKEPLLEVFNEGERDVFPEIGEFGNKANEANEPQINDYKQSCADNGDEPKSPEEFVLDQVEEEHVKTSKSEAAGTIMMEESHCANIQNRETCSEAEKMDNTLRCAGEGEDHNKSQCEEAAYDDAMGEVVDLSSSEANIIFDAVPTDKMSNIIAETQESCHVESNSKVENQKSIRTSEENIPKSNGAVSAVDKDKMTEQSFSLRDDEMLRTNYLHRSASEEIFVENKLHYAYEDLLSDSRTEAVDVLDTDLEENLSEDSDVSKTINDIHAASQEYATKINIQDISDALGSHIRTSELDPPDVEQVLEQSTGSDEGSSSVSSFEKIDEFSAQESEECAGNVEDLTPKKEELRDEMISDERKCVKELSEGLYSQLHDQPKETIKPLETEETLDTDVHMEKDKENHAGILPMEEIDTKEGVQNFESNDQQQRIEAIKRGREREKDRIAVERAIREARERAFAEVRERAERAAVERAATEVRQRVTTDGREKVDKAKQPVDKVATEAKLRAERAAVERATAEARERALEKAKSQKISDEWRTPADRHSTERHSSSSRNNVLKHSYSSSDLETGMNSESAQRRKARLERHQRIMERAAKALAEKNMRDLLMQKEQAERNRFAESLDADIKRWATGKEGNLRALLSTLQYILGPDSGWHPISLTEIITTAAVKKAYRKATLCVHPDKLQQRGASVQQKYVCEKVFDLLKAAWNRFNSDER